MRTDRIAAIALALALAAQVQAQDQPAPAAAAAPPGAPLLAFEKTEIDAGEVTRGQDLSFSFVVRNTGDAVLKILSAKPG